MAETSGDEKNTIVMSAALDSIEEGPGINESGFFFFFFVVKYFHFITKTQCD